MGLTDRLRKRLARWAVSGAHVLLVEAPDGWAARVGAERAIDARGWRVANGPADADVLAVCGRPGPELAAAAARVWDQLPGPRVRVDVLGAERAGAALTAAATGLADDVAQRGDARRRGEDASTSGPADDSDHGDTDHGDSDDGDGDHGAGDMAPHGIPLAEGAPDRDGLEMDVLHLPLGPVLRHWPAGLVLHTTLAGDVVVEARPEVLDPDRGPQPSATGAAEAAARRCDAAADCLALAGWNTAAAAARRVRDSLLDGDPQGPARLAELHRRVRGSRTLRWSLRDLGRVGDDPLDTRRELPDGWRGDAYDRLLALLRPLDAASDAADRRPGEPALAVLPELVTGLELGSVRIVIASLGLGPDDVVRHPAESGVRRA